MYGRGMLREFLEEYEKAQSVQRAETAIQCNRDYVTCTSSEGKMAGSFKPNGGAAPRKSSIRPNRR